MFRKDKYRLIVVFTFAILVISLFILFISLWNNIGTNQDIMISNSIYLFLFLSLIAGIAIFVIYLMQISELHFDQVPQENMSSVEEPEQLSTKKDIKNIESLITPYDIDIDQIAEFIIPKNDPKESLEVYAEKVLKNMAKQFEMVQGVFYIKDETTQVFNPINTYAWASESAPSSFSAGEGLTGQVAKNKTLMKIDNVPRGYIRILSGLGNGTPGYLIILPLLLNKEAVGIIELASFSEINDENVWTFKNLAKIIANSLVTKIKSQKERK